MLSKVSTYRSVTLAEKLTASCIMLEPVAGSALAECVDMTYHIKLEPVTYIKEDGTRERVNYVNGPEAAAQVLTEVSATRDLAGVAQHDVAMNDKIAFASRIVADNLKRARTIVNPIIKEVMGSVNGFIEHIDASALVTPSIMRDDFHPIYSSPALDGMISRYSESPANDFQLEHVTPQMNHEELAALIKTGSAGFDKDVEGFVDAAGVHVLIDTYANMFAKRETAGESKTKFSNYINASSDRNEVLTAHLLARKLLAAPPSETDMNLGDFREYMAGMVEQTGRILNRIQEKRNTNAKSRMLVTQWPYQDIEYVRSEDAVIRVNADLYESWLESGGSPEILFGAYAALTQSQLADAKAAEYLLQNKEAFTKAWQNFYGMQQQQQQAKLYSTTIVALRRAMAKKINELDDDFPIPRERLHERLEEVLGGIHKHHLENHYNLVRKVVCRTMFAHTNAEEILCAIDNIKTESPELDIREAALLATIDVVAHWLASQFKIVKF